MQLYPRVSFFSRFFVIYIAIVSILPVDLFYAEITI